MDKAELKRKWIEALRSGRYRQTTGRLTDGEGGYCCLGVLCAIQDPNWADKFYDLETHTIWGDEWGQKFDFSRELIGGRTASRLAKMNDGAINLPPRSFDHIAGWIEAMIETN